MPDQDSHGKNPRQAPHQAPRRQASRQAMSQNLATMVLSAGLVSLLAFSLAKTRPVHGVPNGMDQASADSFAGRKAASRPFETGDLP